jgi:hypothetical protein
MAYLKVLTQHFPGVITEYHDINLSHCSRYGGWVLSNGPPKYKAEVTFGGVSCRVCGVLSKNMTIREKQDVDIVVLESRNAWKQGRY